MLKVWPLHHRHCSPALFLFCKLFFFIYFATPASSDFQLLQASGSGSLSQAAAAWRLLTTLQQEFAKRGKSKARQAQEAAGPLSCPFSLGL